jgi:PAS domain S-box-containing protein
MPQDIVQQFDSDLNALLVQRVRLGLCFILIINLVIAGSDVRDPSPGLIGVYRLGAMTFGLIGVGFALLRSQWIVRWANPMALAVAVLTCGMNAVGNTLRGDYTATVVLDLLLVFGTSALLPWGVREQCLTVGSALLAMVANVYVVTGGLAAVLKAPAFVVLTGSAISVGLTYELRRHRLALMSENINRRRAEEQVTRLNAELKRRVAERTTQLDAVNDELRREVRERRLAADALQNSQKRLQDILDNSTAVIYVKDLSGRYLLVNLRYERLFHVARAKVIGETDFDVFPPKAAAAFQANDRAVLEANESIQFEETVPHDDGPHTYISVKFPLYDSAGGVAAVCGISTDITDRKEAEARARRHQEELTHVLRVSTMGEMAASLAHEINQPLAAIANYAAGCARRIRASAAEPKDLLPIIDQIAGEALRAGEVVRRLRQLVRKDTQRNEQVDLNQVVQTAVQVIEPEARQHGVAIHLELLPELPQVWGDSIQIEQVILNLLLNAVEAMRATPPTQRVVRIRTSVAGDGVDVAVRDAGSGLEQGIADQAFEPFFTTKANGLGMGLAISRSIIDTHGGRLWATQNGDRGSTFHFTLPCAPCATPA